MLRRASMVCLGIVLAGALRAQDDPPAKDLDPESPYDNAQVLARAMQLIRQDYVDEKKISYRDLTYGALRGMLSELDPHSQFMDPSGFKDMQDDTKSEFGGLGVVVTMEDGGLTIVNPMEDSPGFDAGIKPGDRILRINGTSTEKLTLAQAVEMLKGEIGDKVTLTLLRPSTKEIKDYELTRATIKVRSVKDAQILPDANPQGMKIGYVRITQFNEPTARRTREGSRQIGQGRHAGSRARPALQSRRVAQQCGGCLWFISASGTRVVSTEGRSPGREYRTSLHGAKPRTLPLAILVNYASASGSEVVAGALKDLNRAIIIGETTFGKGSVQSVIALPDGSALRLTTAKYYTPSRLVIHKVGVAPTIRATMSQQQEYDLLDSRRDQENSGNKSVSFANDPQLSRAVDVLRGDLIFTARQQPAKAATTTKGS